MPWYLSYFGTGSFSKYCVWAQICGAMSRPSTKAYVLVPISQQIRRDGDLRDIYQTAPHVLGPINAKGHR